MYKSIILIFSFFIYCNLCFANEKKIDSLLSLMSLEIKEVNCNFEKRLLNFNQKLNENNNSLKSSLASDGEVLKLVMLNINLKNSIQNLSDENTMEISKIRYKKGIQIIQILNEKMLSLDHHFSTVRTFNEINKMANPNSFPEFLKAKDLIKKSNDKKGVFDLPSLLSKNVLASVISSFIGLMGSNKDKEEKTKELEEVSCILDFTLRMHQDLNTIYYETSFLQSTNASVKNDLENLYKDYTKYLGITESLQDCRTNDNWDKIYDELEKYMQIINSESLKSVNSSKASKMQVNLEFSIDRLLQFIILYNNYINQCSQYYAKFKIVLQSYENQKQCGDKLPSEYKKLKDDIDISIQKFSKAYSTVEINGSKMKELLYGIADN